MQGVPQPDPGCVGFANQEAQGLPPGVWQPGHREVEDSLQDREGLAGQPVQHPEAAQTLHEVLPTPAPKLEECLAKGRQTVKSLGDALRWVQQFTAALTQRWGAAAAQDMLRRLHEALSNATLFTAFSGIDAPGTAMEIMSWWVGKQLGVAKPKVRHMAAIEIYSQSQYELLVHPAAAECCFTDIMDFYKPSVQVVIKEAKRRGQPIGFDQLLPMIMEGSAMQHSAFCITHGRKCKLKAASLAVAGTPCTDFSAQGQSAGLDGPTMVHTMAWIGLIRMMQPASFTHENVARFPDRVLQETLGDLYHIEKMVLRSRDLGFPDMRVRAIRTGSHRSKVSEVIQPWHIISDFFTRVCEISWRDLLTCTPEDKEWQEELNWARSRGGASRSQLTDETEAETASVFQKALLASEADNYTVYKERWPHQCYMLGQNPSKHPQKSSGPLLMTTIKNCGLVMSMDHQRWIFAVEHLAAQGFPSTEALLRTCLDGDRVEVCSFNVDRTSRLTPQKPGKGRRRFIPERTRTAVCGQAGNTMNVCMIGSVILWQLAFCVRAGSCFHSPFNS